MLTGSIVALAREWLPAAIAQENIPVPGAKQRLLRPEMKYMPPERIKSWEAEIESANSRLNSDHAPLYAKADNVRMRIVKALHDAGARLLLGTDFPPAFTAPGYSLHEELSNFVAAGLTPYERFFSESNIPATR